eukprot:UN29286
MSEKQSIPQLDLTLNSSGEILPSNLPITPSNIPGSSRPISTSSTNSLRNPIPSRSKIVRPSVIIKNRRVSIADSPHFTGKFLPNHLKTPLQNRNTSDNHVQNICDSVSSSSKETGSSQRSKENDTSSNQKSSNENSISSDINSSSGAVPGADTLALTGILTSSLEIPNSDIFNIHKTQSVSQSNNLDNSFISSSPRIQSSNNNNKKPDDKNNDSEINNVHNLNNPIIINNSQVDNDNGKKDQKLL